MKPMRRFSTPMLDTVSMIGAFGGQLGSPQSLETASVFPEYLPSSSYDTAKLSNWSHFRAPRRFWEYLVFAATIFMPAEITYILLFNKDIPFHQFAGFFVLDAIQLIDLFVILKTPFLQQGILVLGIKHVIIHYGVFNYIVHIIAAIPLGWIGILSHNPMGYGLLSINRLLGLYQCYRIHKHIQYSQAYQGSMSKIFPHFMFFLLVVHLFACLLYWVASVHDLEKSWLAQFVQDGFTVPQLYFACVYFVLTTIFTIGFGDIHPSLTSERIVCIFLEMVGVVYEGFILARMVQLIFDPQRSQFVSQAETLINYLKQKKIDKVYRKHVAHYSQNTWNETHGAPPWRILYKGLPASIKSKITLEFFNEMFENMPLFHGMRQNFFLKLIESMNAFTLIPGEIVYQEGENCPDLFFLKGGIIQFVKNGQPYITQDTGSNYVDGEKEFLFQEPRLQSLVAITFVEGWKISRQSFCDILSSDSRWRKLLFINVRHMYPLDVERKLLNENNMWEIFPINTNSQSQHTLPISLFSDESEQLILAGSSSETL